MICYFLARDPLTRPEDELSLVSLTNTSSGPIAKLQAAEPWYLEKINLVAASPVFKIYIFREGMWREEPEPYVHWTGKHRRKGLPRDYTLEVGVPVCEKWKVEFLRKEVRKFRSKFIPIQFWTTNRWTSSELPG
jgi:hypothetical protein